MFAKKPIPEHPNAVAIRRLTGEQIGWVSREIADDIAPRIDKGMYYEAIISSKTGGGLLFKTTMGCNIKVFPHK